METFTKPLAEGDIIVNLIPQRAPFVMVEKLLYADEIRTVSSFTVTKDNIFCIDGKFVEPGLIENIAQTAALRIGYSYYQLILNGDNTITPSLGFIGAISDLEIYEHPAIGTEIITEVTFFKEVMDVILIKGKITSGEKPVASCEMKIYVKKP